ncbi:MAG TPA: alpha/beta hydrolase [Rubrivivax sp.]|nr:alpha/beta hydrolase [Rubrivivax sp.]
MLDVVVVVVLVVGGLWGVAVVWLRGENLQGLDQPTGERFSNGDAPSPELQAVIVSLGGLKSVLEGVPLRQRNAVLRKTMDQMFADRPLDARFVPVDAGGVRAEWVLAPGADPARRTLYIHGGAFLMGSPKSHRTLTSRFSALTGGAVLAIDYRLMPEHPRRAGIDDCRSAYRWLLDHGPEGDAPAQAVFVAGDSAGGNLTLSLLPWVRDQGLRAPDAAVALSPLTDATLSSPSMRAHVATDPMLGPMFGAMARVPQWVLLWMGWLQTRVRPCDPLVSPLRGDLSRLPPVLLQASEVEMLFDDSRRYVNRAQAAGSSARLQRWNHMVHVWQIFNPELPEAEQALAEIGKFLEAAAPRQAVVEATPPVPVTR